MEILRYLSLPLEFGLILVFFVLCGYKADQYLHTTPLFSLLGGGVGMGAAYYHLQKELKR